MRIDIENKLRSAKKIDVPNSTFVKVDGVLRNLERGKDVKLMKKKLKKSSFIAAAVAAMLFVSTTAFAAWTLLKPAEVAGEFGQYKLSVAFDGDSAININETRSSGGFDFTLLSILLGSDIDSSRFDSEVRGDRTYAVIAVQKSDGSPMDMEQWESGESWFRAGPLVRGLMPWAYFIPTGGTVGVVDGVMYVLVECDDVSIFADRGVYLHISSDFPGSQVINFSEATGDITLNASYDGINVLFDLPLDVSLADPVKAQAFIDESNLTNGMGGSAGAERKDAADGGIDFDEDAEAEISVEIVPMP